MFNKNGPAGFLETKQPLETAELLAGQPFGAEHLFFEDKASGARAGLWHSTAYTERYDSYPVNEFMYIFEGSVTLIDDSGEHVFRAGDSFVLPKGFSGTWQQDEYMLKYFYMSE
ncbi:MAG: cupin domain-containing protein [Pseudomonadota bacterium]